VLEAAQAMAAARADAALLVDARGGLTGILTDTDVTRRVLGQRLDPAALPCSQAMTRGPACVRLADSALDALDTMVSRRFRHLPVLDAVGSVAGLLDIARCLHDAIAALERLQERDETRGGDRAAAAAAVAESVASAVKQAAGGRGGMALGKAQLAAMQAALAAMFGEQMPTLRSLLQKVGPLETVRTSR
jgi:signal-transduction protein with cAMP-binding, CBS, and nucleotidyltransferase domain